MAQSNRAQLKSVPSDIPTDRGGPPSNLRGGLQRKKYKTSPFDRLGSRAFDAPKGKMDTGYA